jgi:hypothetical protein
MLKLKLDNDSLTNDFFENTHLLGIVAPVKDYFLCWQLNNLMHFNFRNNAEMEIRLLKKGRNYYFSLYQYNVPTTERTHYIYNNQFDGEYLLPEFKHLDFLWLIKSDDDDQMELEAVQEIITQIKSIKHVQLVTILTNEKIKNKEHLIF